MSTLRSLILSALMAGVIGLQAQDTRIHLASSPMAGIANLQTAILEPVSENEMVEGHYFRLVQFETALDPQARARISSKGIRLFAYFPSNAYWAAIPATLPPAELLDLGIRGLHKLSPAQKMRGSLRDIPLPSWAVPSPGMLDLELNFPEPLSRALVLAKVVENGFEVLPSAYAGVVSVRIPAHRLDELAAQAWVTFLEPINPPAKAENYTGRTLIRSNAIASDHPMGRHYDGTGVIVAMGDDGIIGPHIDHQGRADQSRVSSDIGTHGDHVAGTIFGAGNLNPKNKGMAFGATLHVYSVWDAVNDGATANATHGTLITSTSYSDGCNAGYTSFARSMDLMTRTTPTLLHVFSAGNEGTEDCGYGAGTGWGNVTGGVKIGKNVLTVASLNFNGLVDGYSSRGPAEDGRIKPEVSAKGGNVTSTFPDNTYATQSGTSMSCPGVSGTTAQLAHAYRELNGAQDPPSALLKAVLMNGCDDKGNAGPDFKYGFGEVNALSSVRALENHTYLADTLSPSENDTHLITVPGGTALLKVMLYWHDYEGNVNAAIPLVSNLDLIVQDPSNQSFQPWILNHLPPAANLNAPATRGRDSINNVEQVTIEAPVPGSYQFIVKSYNLPMGNQGYHLVYEFRDSSITLTYPNGGESLVPGELEKLRWDAEGNSGTFTAEYSTNSGSTWTVISSTIAGSARLLDFTIPAALQSGHMRFRISRGTIVDESDHDLSVIKVPTNLNVVTACPSYFILRWDSMATASGYDVFMLGNKYMDSIGTTTLRSFQVMGTLPNQEYWFAVRARGADGAVGRRTIAIFKGAGLYNCMEPNDVSVSTVSGPGEGIVQACAMDSVMTISVTITNHSPNTVTSVPVSYRFDGGSVVTETYTGTLPGNSSAVFSFAATLPLPAFGTHTVQAWTSFGPDNYTANDSSLMTMQYVAGSAMAVPYSEDFEAFNLCSTSQVCQNANCQLLNGWLQGGNLITDRTEWRTDRGGTPTANTGPSIDHNPGTSLGQYLYVEATTCENSLAMLYTPCLDLSTMSQPYFSYWYNLAGAEMGDLHVDIFADGAWQLDVTPPLIGNYGINWFQRQINLSAYAGQTVNLRFRGLTGTTGLSDMAIDDIQLSNGPPVGVSESPMSAGLQVYPNPGTGVFNYSLAQPVEGAMRLTIMDLRGRIVIEENLHNFTSRNVQGSFDLSDQASGIYFLEISADGQKYGRKIALTR